MKKKIKYLNKKRSNGFNFFTRIFSFDLFDFVENCSSFMINSQLFRFNGFLFNELFKESSLKEMKDPYIHSLMRVNVEYVVWHKSNHGHHMHISCGGKIFH